MQASLSPYVLIYIGTVFYVLAMYTHLSFKPWTFTKAIAFALPLVVVEYIFALNGDHIAHTTLGLSAQQILITTMTFYFVNLWILNYFVLHHKVRPLNELVAFALIIGAFMVTNVF